WYESVLMLGKRKKSSSSVPPVPTDMSDVQISEHPKVMLMDCEPEMASTLQAQGYNVTVGSFGKRYKVPNDGSLRPATPVDAKYSGITEQEVVVIDLTNPPLGEAPNIVPGIRQLQHWVECNSTQLDPRPWMMEM